VSERVAQLTDRPILLSVLLGSAGISASPVCHKGNSNTKWRKNSLRKEKNDNLDDSERK
jgi:hypothetical protein